MRIKVINPNTTQTFTTRIASAARAAAAMGTEVVTVTSGMGPVSIEGHYDEAISVVGMLDEVRRGESERERCDAYVIACFGDPGLLAAREIARGPVLGIAEASMHVASLISHAFSIVTTLPRTRAIARQLVAAYGMSAVCRSIRATDLGVLDLERDAVRAHEVILRECSRALSEDEADAIVLGCAGMADLASTIAQEIGAPVIDGVSAAVKLAEALVALRLGTSKAGDLAWPIAKEYRGMMSIFAPAAADRR